MQDLSFDLKNPRYTFSGLTFSVQVFTYENVYTLDESTCVTGEQDGRFSLTASQLRYAGGQEVEAGTVTLRAEQRGSSITFDLAATCARTIRLVKLVLHQQPEMVVTNLRETQEKHIPAEGLILHYPEGWRNLYTPLVVAHAEQEYRYFRSLDTQVRDKKFVFVRRGDGLDVELIFEELATRASTAVTVPTWEIGTSADAESVVSRHQAHIAAAYQLASWQERPDVPAWARRISLVASIHCQHFTGHIFNTYVDVLDKVRWLTRQIDPEQLLIYLPGWEGRYYWQYGDYRPDARMGGAEGFERLVKSAQDLGVHVMPMFGMNVVNKGMPNFEQWGAPAAAMSAGGMMGGNTVDWDGSRHYDHGWCVFLNVGAPGWQNRLVDQINGLIDRYGFDGVFLDISAGWMNDPRFEMFEGTRQVVQRIRQNHANVLVAGEGWFDAMGAVLPLHQSGHTDGVPHHHDEVFPALFDTYNRGFGHLCLGDPSRGSTGVHELGYNPCWRGPRRKGAIPTMTIVENSLEAAPEKVMEIIRDAQAYAEQFL